MQCSQDATVAINDYVDRVRIALPLSPSARLAVADRLYDDICRQAADRARAAKQDVIGVDVVREVLATMGSSDQCAQRLAAAESQSAAWQWPGDAVADAFRRHRDSVDNFTKSAAARTAVEYAERAARAAAQQGERVAQTSIDVAVQALDVAAQKLREVAEKIRSKQS